MQSLQHSVLRHIRHHLCQPQLDFTDLLAAICVFVSNAKGMSAVQFSRTIDVQYKTAWVMAHKLREAMASESTINGVGVQRLMMKLRLMARTSAVISARRTKRLTASTAASRKTRQACAALSWAS